MNGGRGVRGRLLASLRRIFELVRKELKVASMPRFFQWVAQANPMTHFLVVVRGIFLKGVGMEVLWPRTAILAAMGAVLLTAAALRFRKRAA